MDKELERYYSDRFSMMITRGWKDLLEDVEKMVDAYDNVERLTSVEDLYYAKGQLDILRWILTLKQTSEQAFKELSDEKDI